MFHTSSWRPAKQRNLGYALQKSQRQNI